MPSHPEAAKPKMMAASSLPDEFAKYFVRRSLHRGGFVDMVEPRHIMHYHGPHTNYMKTWLANTLITYSYDKDSEPGEAFGNPMFHQIPAVARHKVVGPPHPDDPFHNSSILGIEVDTFLALPLRVLSGDAVIPSMGRKALHLLVDYTESLRQEVAGWR